MGHFVDSRMARSNKSKSKSKPGSGDHNSARSINPPSSPMPLAYMIPPITTLTPDLDCNGVPPLNQEFPLSSARDEPGTKPLLEPFLFSSPLPKRSGGKKSRSRKVRSSVAKFTKIIQSTKLVRNPTQEINNSPLTCQVVEKVRAKRKKIQVQKSSRVLRPRGSQSLVNKELLNSGTGPAMQPIQDKELQDKENENSAGIPDWIVSWDKWKHVRGTIRRPK